MVASKSLVQSILKRYRRIEGYFNCAFIHSFIHSSTHTYTSQRSARLIGGWYETHVSHARASTVRLDVGVVDDVSPRAFPRERCVRRRTTRWIVGRHWAMSSANARGCDSLTRSVTYSSVVVVDSASPPRRHRTFLQTISRARASCSCPRTSASMPTPPRRSRPRPRPPLRLRDLISSKHAWLASLHLGLCLVYSARTSTRRH